jgi:8-oxo-dGTP pyrophosphatase MutT (NUDIX family)
MPIDSTWFLRPPGIPERFAAGGLVVRLANGRILLALTRDADRPDYILPKGGIERKETPEQAARREIAEEAGLLQLTLLAELGTRGRLNFKRKRWTTTRYFLFRTEEVDFAPTEAAHYAPAWFDLDKLPTLFWPEQRELIESNRATIRQLLLAPH